MVFMDPVSVPPNVGASKNRRVGDKRLPAPEETWRDQAGGAGRGRRCLSGVREQRMSRRAPVHAKSGIHVMFAEIRRRVTGFMIDKDYGYYCN